MLNVTSNNYRQSVTDSDSSVTQNAYANSSSVKHQRSNLLCCVLLRLKRCVNDTEPVKNTGICGENIVFYKPSGTGQAGIVKIPCSKVCFFPAVDTTQKLAHHFLSTLKHVDNVRNSGTEFCTFNPFVVGSTPAGPTRFKSTLNASSKCFFLGFLSHAAWLNALANDQSGLRAWLGPIRVL